MQTKEEVPVQEAVAQQPETKHRSWTPWLIVAAVVVGLVAVGLAIWAFNDDASDPQLETATELVDTMHEGLNENDEEKFMSVFREDAVFGSEDDEIPMSTAFLQFSGWDGWERVSELTELGSLPEVDPNSTGYIFVHEFETDVITRTAIVIHVDGDLISRAYGASDFYVPTD